MARDGLRKKVETLEERRRRELYQQETEKRARQQKIERGLRTTLAPIGSDDALNDTLNALYDHHAQIIAAIGNDRTEMHRLVEIAVKAIQDDRPLPSPTKATILTELEK